VNETFEHADGALNGKTPTPGPGGAWTDHSGTANQVTVTSGTISLTDSDSEDVNTDLGSVYTSGTLYYGFDFSVAASPSTSPSDFEYFAHFKDDGTDFTSRMDIVAAGASGDYSVGIAGSQSVADATWGTNLSFGSTYRAVVEFDFGTGVSKLWIDPSEASDTNISSAADNVPDLSAFAFRQSGSQMNETITVDNLIVATTFDEVASVPEPTSFVLAGLGLFGLFAVRRRRK